MTNHSTPTRLVEYINTALAGLHGHQRKATTDFVLALIDRKSATQAALARFFDNFEAAVKRLSRYVHNPRIELDTTVRAHADFLVARLPRSGNIRIAVDWTSEDTQHLLVASLIVGHRAIPLYWTSALSRIARGVLSKSEPLSRVRCGGRDGSQSSNAALSGRKEM